MTISRHPSLLLIPLLAAVLAAPTEAESPLATPFTGTTGNRVVYFDLTVHPANGVTLTALDLNCGAAPGTPATVQVYVIPGTYLGFTDDPMGWTQGPSGSFVSAGPGLPSHACLGGGMHLAAATYGVAVVTVGSSQLQTGGTSCTSTMITPGACGNASFGNTELTFAGGATSLALFGPTTFHRRIWNGRIHYGLGSFTSACVAGEAVGHGCFTSIYPRFPDAAAAHAALEGQSITFTPIGASYRATWGGGSFVSPAAATPVFAQPTDDGEQVLAPSQPLPTPQGLQAQLRVHSNGIVTWGSAPTAFPGTSTFSPAVAGFLGAANAGVFAWHDFNENETGSGRIVHEERTIAGRPVLFVTWNGVENHTQPEPLPNPTTMQFQFDLTTGAVTIVWQHVDGDSTSIWGSAHLIGCSPGGASADPGAADLAAELPLDLAATDAGVRLFGNAPVVGADWVLFSQEIAGVSPLAFQVFGIAAVAPAIDLGFAGAPGCRVYQTADLGTFAFPASGSGVFTVSVPATGSLAGVVLHTQTVALTLDNALHLATSNGFWGRVGY